MEYFSPSASFLIAFGGYMLFVLLVGCLGGYLVNWFLVAKRLRRMAVKYDALTLPDLLEARTGGHSPTIRIVAVAIIFTSMMAYVGAQLIAAGKTFEFTLSSFGVDYRLGVLLGALITITYTTAGGYRAVAWKEYVRPGFGLYELIPAFFLGLIVNLLVSLATRLPEEAGEGAVG